jgi:hypothetical protein
MRPLRRSCADDGSTFQYALLVCSCSRRRRSYVSSNTYICVLYTAIYVCAYCSMLLTELPAELRQQLRASCDNTRI